MYIDKLDDIVDEYNNTSHRTIKMKPVNVKDNHILILVKKLMSVMNIMLEYQNTKIFLLQDILQIGLKKFL